MGIGILSDDEERINVMKYLVVVANVTPVCFLKKVRLWYRW